MGDPSEGDVQVVFYPDGTVKMRGSIVDGGMHGAWEWFRRDGSVMRTGHFERGTQVGAWRTYDGAGRMAKETDFTKRG